MGGKNLTSPEDFWGETGGRTSRDADVEGGGNVYEKEPQPENGPLLANNQHLVEGKTEIGS